MDSSSGGPFVPDGIESSSLRARSRDSLFVMARLQFDGEAYGRDVRVRNLSEGGLMAECARVVDAGTSVNLDVRGIGPVTGKVAWCTEGRIGIALDTKIDPRRARRPIKGSGVRPSGDHPASR